MKTQHLLIAAVLTLSLFAWQTGSASAQVVYYPQGYSSHVVYSPSVVSSSTVYSSPVVSSSTVYSSPVVYSAPVVYPPATYTSGGYYVQQTTSYPNYYPYVVARAGDRAVIQSTPIEYRPNRPLHFYGNMVRRNYYAPYRWR